MTIFPYFQKNLRNVIYENLHYATKLKILSGISEGIQYLHENGIIHKDIKPDNILLDSNYCPLIIDFGISDINKETSFYLAPEILKENEYKTSSDIYSLGVLIFEMFTKTFLVKIENKDQFFQEELKEFNQEDIKEIINGCIDLVPEKRIDIKNLNQKVKEIYQKIEKNCIQNFEDYQDKLKKREKKILFMEEYWKKQKDKVNQRLNDKKDFSNDFFLNYDKSKIEKNLDEKIDIIYNEYHYHHLIFHVIIKFY